MDGEEKRLFWRELAATFSPDEGTTAAFGPRVCCRRLKAE